MGFISKLIQVVAPAVEKPAAIEIDVLPNIVNAPCGGQGTAMAQLSDPVFSSGAMGKAYGIVPDANVIYAPVTGKITAVTPTLHALALTSTEGIEVLIHVGVNTVSMRGEGFQGFVEKGQDVIAGEPLMSFDRAKIADAGLDDTVIVVITNSSELPRVEPKEPTVVVAGDAIFDVELAASESQESPVVSRPSEPTEARLSSELQ